MIQLWNGFKPEQLVHIVQEVQPGWVELINWRVWLFYSPNAGAGCRQHHQANGPEVKCHIIAASWCKWYSNKSIKHNRYTTRVDKNCFGEPKLGLLSIMVFDWATLGWSWFPVELHADLWDVPLFIPQRLEHFSPNHVRQSSGFCFKMNMIASLRFGNPVADLTGMAVLSATP